jgi:hypothetical protein
MRHCAERTQMHHQIGRLFLQFSSLGHFACSQHFGMCTNTNYGQALGPLAERCIVWLNFGVCNSPWIFIFCTSDPVTILFFLWLTTKKGANGLNTFVTLMAWSLQFSTPSLILYIPLCLFVFVVSLIHIVLVSPESKLCWPTSSPWL